MKLLIADDHAILRKGLTRLLLEQYPFAHIQEAEDAYGLLKMAMKEKWDVIITDISMPGKSGLEALSEIKDIAPKTPVLVLSLYPEDTYGVRVLKSGAAGYINKEASNSELLQAVETVLNGHKYITPSIAENLANHISMDVSKEPHELLSDREFEIMKLIASGKPIQEISKMLSLSPTTVSTYRSRILQKMNFTSNSDLVKYALQSALI